MNIERRTWWVGRILALLLILASLRTAYWQLWRGLELNPVALDPAAAAQVYARMRGEPAPDPGAPEAASLAQLPQPVIQRTVRVLSSIRRGTIFDRAGNVLAEDRGAPGSYARVYTEPSLAHVVGYASALRTGITGLEATYNSTLLGFDRAGTNIDRMLNRPVYGSSLALTIDSRVQRAASEALAGRAGAVVALDAQTGAVLAMVSAPGFDPNRINDPEYSAALQGSSALINRPTQGLYIPGSTYKTVTLIAGLETGEVTPETVVDFGEPKTNAEGRPYYTYEVEGGVIYDANHRENRLDLRGCYVTSANAAFARFAYEMDPERFIDYGQRLGFSAPDYTGRFPLELPVAEPQLAYDLDDLRTNGLLRAHTGYGQGELLTTPLNMAMVVQAVVNDGAIPVPYLVERVLDPEGKEIRRRPNNHTVRGVMRAETAEFVREAMIAVGKAYWGEHFIAFPDAVGGGKTGTAEVGDGQEPHAWFVGFAGRGERSVVITVIVENAGTGGNVAVPIFQAVAEAALRD